MSTPGRWYSKVGAVTDSSWCVECGDDENERGDIEPAVHRLVVDGHCVPRFEMEWGCGGVVCTLAQFNQFAG